MGEVTKYKAGALRASLQVVLFSDYDSLKIELEQCGSMAAMIEEKEWAEHAGTGPVSSRVESAFTQLHNELSEARERLVGVEQFIQKMVDCSKGQNSIATGYLSDILSVIKGDQP